MDDFVRSRSDDAPYIDAKRSRFIAAQAAWSSMTVEVDGLLTRWEEELEFGLRMVADREALVDYDPALEKCIAGNTG